MRKMAPKKISKKLHFSLIELLVVISLIAILVSMLLPALRKVREQAKRIQCVGNQKQAGVAFGTYSGDYNGYYPAPNINEYGNYWSNVLYSLYLSDKGLLGDGANAYVDNIGFCIDGCQYEEETIFHCPSALKKEKFSNNFEGKYFMSYAMNGYLIKNNYNQHVQLSRILKPSAGYLVMDENHTVSLNGWSFWQYSDKSFATRIHEKGRNILYVDGHANYLLYSKFPSWSMVDERYPFWYGL
jgi:prepilin-type processing-associated H-X9-DG protein